jgi:hypothetical protein
MTKYFAASWFSDLLKRFITSFVSEIPKPKQTLENRVYHRTLSFCLAVDGQESQNICGLRARQHSILRQTTTPRDVFTMHGMGAFMLID